MISPLIFLDFDGVIVLRPSLYKYPDRKAVERLNDLVRLTGAKVVVSSTWRLHYSLAFLQDMLEASGFEGELVGMTPTRGKLPSGLYEWEQRGHEIAHYRATSGHTGPFVILDDDSDMGDLMPHLVLTSHEFGLEDQHVQQAVEILKGLP